VFRSERRRFPAVLIALTVVALLGAGVIGGVIAHRIENTPSPTPTSCNVTTVAKDELPSVVTIVAGGGVSGGVGSGEVIRPDGYILTNNHVILPAVGEGPLQVRFNDGRTVAASITGRDPLSDLAVIKVSGESGLRRITIGDSGGLRIGQPVVALGAPLGLSNTVTSGIVSALGRTVHVPGEGSQSALLVDAVQTDAAINPGNSGGALVNCSGALVGVPTAGATVPSPSGEASGGSIGLGFAIPVNLAMMVASEIIATGTVTHAFLGIQAEPIAPAATAESAEAAGLLVTAVVPGSPASSAGLASGDIITSIDGKPAVSTDQLVALTLSRRAGDRVEIGYRRGGASATVTVTLSSRP